MKKQKLYRTVRTTVYKFEGLSESAKAKAIESLRDINLDYEWWDAVYEDFRMLCEKIGINVDVKQTYFSGFGHQGQGSAFTADIPSTVEAMKAIAEEKWKEHAPNTKFSFEKPSRNVQRVLKLIEHGSIYWSADIETAGREKSVNIKTWYRFGEEYISDLSNLEKAIEELEEYLQDVADTLNHWLFKRLEDENDYLYSDEAVKETIIANEYEFTKEGNKF